MQVRHTRRVVETISDNIEKIQQELAYAREVRTFAQPVEVRAAEDGSKRIVGYAARFNMWSEVLGYWMRFKERILPGAFASVLNDDVRGLFNHDSNLVLGRTTSGTLSISEDELGLRYTIHPPATTWANDLIVVMERGDVTQSSFSFQVDTEDDGDEWEYDEEQELWLRTIKKFKRLYDVSPVTFPAYPQTDSVVAAKRSFELYQARLKAAERAEDEEPPDEPVPDIDEERRRRLAIELDLL
ncbi:MAG TPA: HK97 family phage prohead protease [Bacillota bacterium]|nr:HK97 family phage prohead protease [Bacillota bacterium]